MTTQKRERALRRAAERAMVRAAPRVKSTQGVAPRRDHVLAVPGFEPMNSMGEWLMRKLKGRRTKRPRRLDRRSTRPWWPA